MKCAPLLVALSGCNAIFGLDETTNYDAGHIFTDAPIDAPRSCPDPSVVPQFDRELHQAVYADENCYTYQASDIGIALASCRDPVTFITQVSEGRVGPITEMYPAMGDINDPNNPVYSFALMPEGSDMLAARYDTTLNAYGVWRYEREATGAWNRREHLAFSAVYQTLGAVSRGPLHHTLVRITTSTEVHEWAQDDTGVWKDVATYVPADFGLSYIYTLDLSADGLRLLVFGNEPTTNQYGVHYSYRANIADRFSSPTKVPSFSNTYIYDLFLSSDCDRLFFPGFGAVFYVKRI